MYKVYKEVNKLCDYLQEWKNIVMLTQFWYAMMQFYPLPWLCIQKETEAQYKSEILL